MNAQRKVIMLAALLLPAAGCDKKFDPAQGAPSQSQMKETGNMALVTVERPELFPIATAQTFDAPEELKATGTVQPDVSREVPVISLASGRVVDIKTRLGNEVKKGELLLRVQSNDITSAFDTYLKARNDEQLANKAYVRAKDLYEHGAVPLSQLEQAEDSEKDALADLRAAEEQLRVLGVDKNHPSPIVNVYAPISGVIISQNVTNAAAVGVTYSGSSTAFTIADISHVWIICDIYENDLSKIKVGQSADIEIAGFPGKKITGLVTEVDPALDPSIRTAKARIEVPNPGYLKLGMFVTATIRGVHDRDYASVPADAILHLHDRDWVYVPVSGKQFRRVEVHAGDMLPGNRQVILSGVSSGQHVVSNVLQLEATLEGQ